MSDLYFNEKNDYSEENTSGNEYFRSTILQPFQFDSEQKKTCGNEDHERETTETKHMLQLPICYILEKEISISVNADIAKTKRQK